MNTKVTVQEVVDALNAYAAELKKVGFVQSVSQTIQERIQAHGIEVAYTPMTEIDRYRIKDSFRYATSGELGKIAIVEQAVLASLGNPTVKDSLIVDQAKCVCEEAGLAVVPKNPAAGGWNEDTRGVE